MKIFIDIGHPAHVHYFRNFLKKMQEKGHQVKVTARDKEVIHFLLHSYHIPYKNRGKGANRMLGKLLYIPRAEYILYREARRFQPDLFLSFASPYAAHVSWFMNKPHIVLDDTDCNTLNHILYRNFSSVILTPTSFKKNMGKKHLMFNGFMELSYLHPNHYKPDAQSLNDYGLKKNEYAVVRFVSWNASHDVGLKGFDNNTKVKLVEMLSEHMKVIISSEGKLPKELERFQKKISPEKLHDLLAYAKLYIGEGATTASECVMLGTPAVYVNHLSAGTLEEQEKLGLLYNLRNANNLNDIIESIILNKSLKDDLQSLKNNMLESKIDITAFLVWFVENYPDSVKTMRKNPDYQYRFK